MGDDSGLLVGFPAYVYWRFAQHGNFVSLGVGFVGVCS